MIEFNIYQRIICLIGSFICGAASLFTIDKTGNPIGFAAATAFLCVVFAPQRKNIEPMDMRSLERDFFRYNVGEDTKRDPDFIRAHEKYLDSKYGSE